MGIVSCLVGFMLDAGRQGTNARGRTPEGTIAEMRNDEDGSLQGGHPLHGRRMTFEDRRAIVATVEETYALMGRTLSTDIPSPLLEIAVRPTVLGEIQSAQLDPYVTDEEMLVLLRTAYFDLTETVLRLHQELLGGIGDEYDIGLENVALTGSGLEVKVVGFNKAIRFVGRVLGFRSVRKAFEWGNIVLGSLGAVPVSDFGGSDQGAKGINRSSGGRRPVCGKIGAVPSTPLPRRRGCRAAVK
jgi:hypothetical protein